MKNKFAFVIFLLGTLLFLTTELHAQPWTEIGITETGDTIVYRFPPPDSTYLHNKLILKFYNGGLYTDSLCYDCEDSVTKKGKHLFDVDPTLYFSSCRQTLLQQHFTLGIIQDPIIRVALAVNGASYVTRMTAANPCTDTLSITRRGDTIPSDDYNWVEVTFDNDTGLIPAIEALFSLHPATLQLADLAHLMQAASVPLPRTPNDSEYHAGNQRSLNMIGMPMAWGYNVGDTQIKVAVVDRGVDWRRCELGGLPPSAGNVKVTGGLDYNTMTADGVDNLSLGDPNHGTACASIIAAFTNNGSCAPRVDESFAWGMAGIAGGWGTFDDDTSTGGTGAQILAYKIDVDTGIVEFGELRSDWAASAVLEASSQSPNGPYGYGAHIINNSYGYDSTFTRDTVDTSAKDVFPALRAAAASAYRNAVCFVACKQNYFVNTAKNPVWPADFNPQKDIIAIGASDYKFTREDYSNFGRTTDLIAPGGWLTPGDSIVRAQSYGVDTFFYFGGTSAATPHVCGVLALMRGFYSGTVIPYTEDWEGLLEASVMSLAGKKDTSSVIYSNGYDTNLCVGWGFLRADSALEKLDPTGADHYQLFHYSVPLALCDTGAWVGPEPLILEADGFRDSLLAGPYTVYRREITGSENYSSSIDTTRQVYTWGNGGDGVGIGGWSIASPNSQEPWSEVTDGLGGISGSPVNIREGIWHQQSRTVTAHSFQYEVLIRGSYVHYPADSLCGVSFSVYGSAFATSGVASAPTPTGNGMAVFPTITDQTARAITSPSTKASEFEIVNSLGVVVDRQRVTPGSGELTINTSELPEGFYICRLLSEVGTETAKFIVRH